MKPFYLPADSGPDEFSTLLFAGWVQLLAEQRLSLRQHGSGGTAENGQTFNFGVPGDRFFELERAPSGEWRLKSMQGLEEHEVELTVAEALSRTSAGDFGDDVVYNTTMQVQGFTLSPVSTSHFMRLLGDQVSIDGSRRLGDRVLLDFQPEAPADPSAPQLFAPPASIKVTLFAPGPVAGDLAQKTAAGMVETIAAICALALGRVVETPIMIFPAGGEEAEAAGHRRYDRSILGLDREGVSLDIFGEFAALGGPDGMLRVRGALLSYHAALKQSSPDVAMMLLVSSLEALIVPRAEWRKEKATKRFIVALGDLCGDTLLDSVVEHANVEQAFGYKKKGSARNRRRQLLDRIYDQRSNPTHSGIGLSGAGMLSAFADPGSMRVALLSDLARGALLKFLQAPRSSLVGHPMFESVDAGGIA